MCAREEEDDAHGRVVDKSDGDHVEQSREDGELVHCDQADNDETDNDGNARSDPFGLEYPGIPYRSLSLDGIPEHRRYNSACSS